MEGILTQSCRKGLGTVGGVPDGVRVEHLTGTRVSTEVSLADPPLRLLLPLLLFLSAVAVAAGVVDVASEVAARTTGSATLTKKDERLYGRGVGHVQSNRPALDDDGHPQSTG